MNPRTVLRGIFVLGLGLLLSAGAQAQPMPSGFQATAFRTYLSGSGNDANLCTLVAPCRLLPRAIAVAADGGEVWMLDSANYNSGPVNIDRSVTILAVPGALGSVVALGGNAINITTPGVRVTLRNLVIVPYVGGVAIHGITMSAGASLTVENCMVANLPSRGIYVNASGASVLVMDSTIRGNGNYGLYVENGVRATVTRTVFSGNGTGVHVQGSVGSTTTTDITDSTLDANDFGMIAVSTNATAAVKVSVRNSQVVRNEWNGLLAQSDGGGSVNVSASNNIISNNTYGMTAYKAGARVWASGNTVSGSATGFANNSAVFESAGDNAVRNNETNAFGAITPIAAM